MRSSRSRSASRRRATRRLRPQLVAIVVIALAAISALPASGDVIRGPVGFSLSGSVDRLYPGARRWMTVTVQNPYTGPLRLVSVRAGVRSSRSACSHWNVEVRPFRGRLRIRPRGRRTLRLLVTMAASAPDECRQSRFRLSFHGRAVLQ